MYVNVNYTTMKKNSEDIKSRIEHITALTKLISEKVEGAQEYWSGEKANVFYKRMTEVLEDMKNLEKYLNTYNNLMINYSNIINELEEKINETTISIE